MTGHSEAGVVADGAAAGRRFSLRQFALAGSVTFAGLVAAWLLLTGKPAPQAKAPEPPRRAIVAVVTAQPTTQSLTVTTQGTVEPMTQIALVAQVAGIVESVSAQFRDGGYFNAGDLLLQIEPDDYEFAIARARASVATAEQRLAEERGRALQAKREWRDLGSTDANDLFLRKPQIRAAEASLDAAKADLNAAELALERTRVRAPFAGRIVSRGVDRGQYVAPGAALAEIYATETMQVRLPLTDSQLALLDLPLLSADTAVAQATLTATVGAREWQWFGQIRRTEAQVDRDSRVVYAIAEVVTSEAPGTAQQPPLTPGLFVRADITGRALPAVSALPATALRADNTVLVVREGGRLERLEGAVQLRRDDRAWVTGLRAGDRVVAEQSSSLIAGALVDIAPADAAEV
jgi:RND family efflux transporter MFP subunit